MAAQTVTNSNIDSSAKTTALERTRGGGGGGTDSTGLIRPPPIQVSTPNGPASTTSTSSGNGTPRRVKFDASLFDPTIGSRPDHDRPATTTVDASEDALHDRLITLSNEVARVQADMEEERQRRRLLELENETLKLKVLSLTMMNPEAAAALDAVVDNGGISANGGSLVGDGYSDFGTDNSRDRAFTSADMLPASPLAVCRDASMDDAMLTVEFEDRKCVLVVRHIDRIGFAASHTLAAYFAVFAAVREVITIQGTELAVIIMVEEGAVDKVMQPGGNGSTRIVNGGEVEIATYNYAVSSGWLCMTSINHTSGAESTSGSTSNDHYSPVGSAKRRSPLAYGSLTSNSLSPPLSSARSHAQTWDATSLPLGGGRLGSNHNHLGTEMPRMNLLEALQVFTPEDEKKVFTVRKVHKLGFKSQHAIRQYFNQFGKVKDVVLLPMRAKPKPGPGGQVRGVRPSSMGFVVMQSAEDVQKILAQGSTHTVKGWPIEVRPFVRPSERRESLAETVGSDYEDAASHTAKSLAMSALDDHYD